MIFEEIHKDRNSQQSIFQGQISFGSHSQSTFLGSCISLILFSDRHRLGGLSHIVGRETSLGRYSLPEQAVDEMLRLQIRHGIDDPEFYLIGGSTSCRFVLEGLEYSLKRREVHYEKKDVLGSYHRKVILIPEERKVQIYRKGLKENSFDPRLFEQSIEHLRSYLNQCRFPDAHDK